MDEIMNRLSNRLKYLACDVGERERKLNSAKAQYVSESRDYQNSQNRRGRRNRNPYMMNDRHYQMPPHYNPGGLWPGTSGAHPRDMGVSPWSMPPPPQNWKYPMPKRRPSRRRNVPHGQWAVCWNFNSARGCSRGTSCPWRHQKYSNTGNVTGEPSDDGTKEIVNQTSIPSKSLPLQWIPNVKARDIDTDSKMQQETSTSALYGYNGGEATESDTDASGVE